MSGVVVAALLLLALAVALWSMIAEHYYGKAERKYRHPHPSQFDRLRRRCVLLETRDQSRCTEIIRLADENRQLTNERDAAALLGEQIQREYDEYRLGMTGRRK